MTITDILSSGETCIMWSRNWGKNTMEKQHFHFSTNEVIVILTDAPFNQSLKISIKVEGSVINVLGILR